MTERCIAIQSSCWMRCKWVHPDLPATKAFKFSTELDDCNFYLNAFRVFMAKELALIVSTKVVSEKPQRCIINSSLAFRQLHICCLAHTISYIIAY